MTFIDNHDIDEQRRWSDETFGPGERVAGVLDHIRKELVEVEADPNDLTEWVDVMILALDGATRQGYTGTQVIEAYLAKMEKNHQRSWPDWRTADPNKAIEHIRDEVAS